MKIRIAFAIGSLLYIGFLVMNSMPASASYEKPIYYIKFNINQADVRVALNDIPVLRHDAPGVTESEKPVPESVVDGENVLEVMLSPLEGDEDLFARQRTADVSLIVREKGAPLNEFETLLHIKLTATDNKDQILQDSIDKFGKAPAILVEFSDKKISAKRAADIDSPFPRWAWQDGLTIENNEETFNSLFNEYRKVYQVLKSEEMDRIRELYSNAAKEYAAAYHYQDVTEGHRIMNTGSLVNDDEWFLGDIQKLVDKGVKLNLEIHGNGKLARIVNDNGQHIVIVYLNKKVRMVSFQKFDFYKNKNNKWVMIR